METDHIQAYPEDASVKDVIKLELCSLSYITVDEVAILVRWQMH